MIRNNNHAVALHLAKNHLKKGKQKSMTMISTVLLSSFMLFCIFSIGITYFKMLRLQNLRLQSGDYDAILYGVTEEQMDICKKNPDVLRTGLNCLSGYIDETEYDKTPDVVLMYADHVYWDEMKAPVKEWVKGKYPAKEDEVMVTEYALKKCGFQGLDVGDSIQVTYGVREEKFEKVFRIAGIWDGFGDKSVFFVSEQFYKQTGLKPSDVSSGRFLIDFDKNIMTQKEQEEFLEQLHLDKKQSLVFTGDIGYSVQIFAGTVGLALVICLCAYLLIYNIMYLSVADNIRYYGLLQTMGMTQRQTGWFMNAQILLIGGSGMTGGLLAGGIVCFALVPVIIKSLGIRTGQSDSVMISFYPAVFVLTFFLTGFTVWIASRKPAKTAVMCSPVEALGYRPAAGIKKSRKIRRGSLLWRMAKEQLAKDKKRSAVVMLSLAAGMTVFLSVTTLIKSQDPQNVNNYRNIDLILNNDTVRKEKKEDRLQVFDRNLVNEIKSADGVKEAEPIIYAEITIPWEPDFMERWMKEFYDVWMEIPYEDDALRYQEHPEDTDFISSLIGITDADFADLNQTLEEPMDEQAFLDGKTCLLYRSRLTLQNQDITGKTITCRQYEDYENVRSFEIAGFTDMSGYTAYLGYTPTIIVSDRVVKEFVKDPAISRVNIWYEKEFDQDTEKEVFAKLNQISHANDFSYVSKIEDMKEIKKAQGNMMEIGIGIVLILALIGFMNYVNTSVGNIQSRQKEISIMESIGMTGKQVKKMLAMEGFLYAGGAWLVTMTAGMGAAYWLLCSMSYGSADFEVPIAPLLAAMLITIAACISVPVFVYCRFEKRSAVAERIKGIE